MKKTAKILGWVLFGLFMFYVTAISVWLHLDPKRWQALILEQVNPRLTGGTTIEITKTEPYWNGLFIYGVSVSNPLLPSVTLNFQHVRVDFFSWQNLIGRAPFHIQYYDHSIAGSYHFFSDNISLQVTNLPLKQLPLIKSLPIEAQITAAVTMSTERPIFGGDFSIKGIQVSLKKDDFFFPPIGDILQGLKELDIKQISGKWSHEQNLVQANLDVLGGYQGKVVSMINILPENLSNSNVDMQFNGRLLDTVLNNPENNGNVLQTLRSYMQNDELKLNWKFRGLLQNSQLQRL